MKTNLDYALAYAELGYYVFPCHTPIKKSGWNCSCEAWKRKHNPDFECPRAGKHPRSKRGLDDATLDAGQIRQWWQRWPDANIGINCGLSGLLVVDLDSYKDFYDGDDLELEEETVTALTGGGGNHLVYKMEDGDLFGNSNKRLPDGIDIRGHGGYIVAAPSKHASGGVYQWELDYSPWDREPAPLPPLLRGLLQASTNKRMVNFDTTVKFEETGTRYGIAAVRNQCEAVASSANGTRNNTLNEAAFSLARLVAGGEVDERYARNSLQIAAAAVELSEEEATRTIDSGFEAGIMHPYSTVESDEYAHAFGECPDPSLLSAESNASDESVGGMVAFVANMLRMTIEAGQPVDDLKQMVSRLGDADRREPVIVNELSKALKRKKIDEWLASCGHVGDTKAAKWLAALRGLGHEFALNQLEDNIEVDGKPLDDVMRSHIYLAMNAEGAPKTYVDDVMNVAASENTYHPVRDYLNGLKWDGQDHVWKFLSCLTGNSAKVSQPDGEKMPLYKLLIARWMLGCAARGLHSDDGTPFKHQTPMLVFVGKQGAGKSTLVKWLASGVGLDYFQEGALNPASTDDQRSMVTKWIWEVAELGSSLRRTDRDALKGFITTEWHTYRKPYGKSSITKPTLCNLVGSINAETGFLDDPTGHRRFLPVTLTSIDWSYKDEVDVNQLWAHVVHLYKNTQWGPELSSKEKEALSKEHERHEVENPIETYIYMYFNVRPGTDIDRMFTADIIQRLRDFGITLNHNPRIAAREVNDVLDPMGLTRLGKVSIDGVKGAAWGGITANEKLPPWAQRKSGDDGYQEAPGQGAKELGL